jgi:hypothetical protein
LKLISAEFVRTLKSVDYFSDVASKTTENQKSCVTKTMNKKKLLVMDAGGSVKVKGVKTMRTLNFGESKFDLGIDL